MISADDIKLVQARFSGAADHYDQLAFVQNKIREELLAKVGSVQGRDVLDVGCGTGVLLGELARQANRSVGVDLAWGMLAHAKKEFPSVTILQADGCALPLKGGSFDLVVSTSSYQWAEKLDVAFTEVHRVLKPGGKFHSSLFGRETLGELFESLEAVSFQNESGRLVRLPSETDVETALEGAGFRSSKVVTEMRTVEFRDLWSLLMWLKSVGANSLGRGIFLGPKAVAQAGEYYRRNYASRGGITATFEIVWVEGRK